MTEATEPETNTYNRRRFMRQVAAISALGAGGYAASRLDRTGDGSPQTAFDPQRDAGLDQVALSPSVGSDPIGRLVDGASQERVLVIVDLQGGNDGLSTLVPAGDGRYYDLRPDTAVPADEVLTLDDEVGLHPSLARLHKRGITSVEGIGPVNGDLSHFSMTQRWQRGDVDGTGRHRTGFLGRLIDAVDDNSPLVGVSLAGPTPYLLAQQAAAMSIDGLDSLQNFSPRDWVDHQAWLSGVHSFAAAAVAASAGGGDGGGGGSNGGFTNRGALLALAAKGYADLVELGPQIETEQEVDWEQPILSEGGDLGRQLFLADRVLQAEVGVRVVYVAMGGYDTHQGHQWRQADNLTRVDVAVDEFLRLIDDQGRAENVLVATVSEFGRRVGESGGGLDHGTASTMLLAGPVGDRRLGERADLGALDTDGNLPVPIGFDRYLAGLAQEWMGIEAGSVLSGDPQPLSLIRP